MYPLVLVGYGFGFQGSAATEKEMVQVKLYSVSLIKRAVSRH
jgi:hypothetical protein